MQTNINIYLTIHKKNLISAFKFIYTDLKSIFIRHKHSLSFLLFYFIKLAYCNLPPILKILNMSDIIKGRFSHQGYLSYVNL